MRRGSVVIVFSREPSPGRVKTRLMGRLGAWGAARLHARLTRRALRTALAADVGAVEVHATPRPRSAFFAGLRKRNAIALKTQRGGDLGERMHRALAQALRRHRGAILIGTDCPALEPSDLRKAARLLCGAADVVLAPAEDGGYALIAARRVSPELFAGIHWGSASVYGETLARLAASRFRLRPLRTVWDVDRPPDLDRLRSLRFASGSQRPARR